MSDPKAQLEEQIATLEKRKWELEQRIASFDGYTSRTLSSSGGSKSLSYGGIAADKAQLSLIKKMIAEKKAALAGLSRREIKPLYAEFSR